MVAAGYKAPAYPAKCKKKRKSTTGVSKMTIVLVTLMDNASSHYTKGDVMIS